MDTEIFAYLAVAVALVLFRYISAPLTVKRNTAHPLNPIQQRYDPNLLPPEVAAFFYEKMQALLANGFTVVDYVTRPTPHRTVTVTSVVVYLTNRSTGDMATIAAMYVDKMGQIRLKSMHVFCHRIFTDGSRVLIGNDVPAGPGSVLKSRPYAPSYVFEGPMDTAELYRIFLYAVEKHAGGRTPVIPPAGQELEAFAEAERDTMEYQVKCGLLKVDAERGAYVKTLYGAYYMTWSLLWPIKPIKMMLRRRRSAALLAEIRARQGRSA